MPLLYMNPHSVEEADLPYDPHWNNVVLLLHMDGAHNSTSFADAKGRAVTSYGGAVQRRSSPDPIVGSASGFFNGSSQYLIATAQANDLAFGLGDFTIEWRMRPVFKDTPTYGQNPIDLRPVQTNGQYLLILYSWQSNRWLYISNGQVNRVNSQGVIPDNVDSAIAYCRKNQVGYLFVNGELRDVGPDPTNMPATPRALIGAGEFRNVSSDLYYSGSLDEVRITKGVARYHRDYRVRQSPFPNVGPN